MTHHPPLGLPMVYLVDDEPVVRDALGWLLRTRRLLSQGHACAEEFIASYPHPWRPTAPCCMVLDMRMPGLSGLQLFDQLLARDLSVVMPVIFLTGHGDVPTAVAAVKRGAFDFVEKPFSDNALVDRIEQALSASTQALHHERRLTDMQRRFRDLTERERDVMRHVIAGRPNKLIADELDISVRTVEVHRAKVFEKLNVKSAVELANLIRELPPDLP